MIFVTQLKPPSSEYSKYKLEQLLSMFIKVYSQLYADVLTTLDNIIPFNGNVGVGVGVSVCVGVCVGVSVCVGVCVGVIVGV
jgi:hypothetical protein